MYIWLEVLILESTSKYLIIFSNVNVSWQYKLQSCVTLLTTEAEFLVATKAYNDMLFMKRFLYELIYQQKKYVLHCASQSDIHLSKNMSFHSKSNHIDVQYYYMFKSK